MEPILCGIETEYGLGIAGQGADKQIDHAEALVRSYSGERFSGWDYRYESPRRDLRGFTLEGLSVDPIDAQFDAGAAERSATDSRADQILSNGARFYNDHGHPEYATPECNDAFTCALQDRLGEFVALSAASSFTASTGLEVDIYKNNTDFHGASYGTHESYSVPRELGWEKLYKAVTPMLIVRPILCGAGKVGSESGAPARFQQSQRADFFVEALNAETLYRRPIFNTRDEPHADPAQWMRLHVIAGDATMSLKATARKIALVKLAIQLAIVDRAPQFEFANPVAAAKTVSRDLAGTELLELTDGRKIAASEVLEAYFEAAERANWLGLMESLGDRTHQDPFLAPFTELAVVVECRDLLALWKNGDPEFRRHVDWAAKRYLVESYAEAEGRWNEAQLQAIDLEFAHVDRERSLFWALVRAGEFDDFEWNAEFVERELSRNTTGTRSELRSFAIRRFGASLKRACWRTLTFAVGDRLEEVELPVQWRGRLADDAFLDVESFVNWLRGPHD